MQAVEEKNKKVVVDKIEQKTKRKYCLQFKPKCIHIYLAKQCYNSFSTRMLLQGVPKTDTQYYFWDNFGNSAPILTTLSLLQAEIYGALT